MNFVQDHFEKDYGQEYSARWDTNPRSSTVTAWLGWLDSLKAGVRYGDRHQQVDYSEYNWSNVVANWDGWGNGMGPGFSITNTSRSTNQPMPGHDVQ